MSQEQDAAEQALGRAAAGWGVDLDVAATLAGPDGGSIDRDEFFGWLWAECGAGELLGICEGALGVDEAAARGLAEPRVVDAAAAPPERDWVGGLDTQAATCWFADESSARRAAELVGRIGGCRVRAIRPLAATPTADWRESFAPIVVPSFGVVKPAWEEGVAGTVANLTTMFIEPGCGFGTGEHSTTQLCLMALADWVQAGGRVSRVLDFGSGSGILASAAALRGADRVEAIEIDDRTHAAIRANCRRNGVEARVGVLAELPDPGAVYDLVFANIVPAVLIEHAERLCGHLRHAPAGGCLVLSGLVTDEVGVVVERYARLLATDPVCTGLGEWHCLRFATVPSRQRMR
jgi:ribosomal protein L11 methyltransferase